jgi:hypothetical protein
VEAKRKTSALPEIEVQLSGFLTPDLVKLLE